jgi:glutamate-5-semialdehyde dehydrogenase
MAAAAKEAARAVSAANGALRNRWLLRTAELLAERTDQLLEANRLDTDAAPEFGLTSAEIDRLTLTPSRLNGLIQALHETAALPDPVGEVISGSVRPNGLCVSQIRVPLGVVFFIYESRPNVTVDAAALCVKSGNAVILRGGKEALHGNTALAAVCRDGLRDVGLPLDAVQLVETTDRGVVGDFLKLSEYITVAIPRGGRGLIERVTREATMPVIKHFDGVCHVYVDKSCDLAMAEKIVINGKCQRPGVCNATEAVLIHADIATEAVPRLAAALRTKGVEIRGCSRTRKLVPDVQPATETDYRTEYLALVISMRVVDDLPAAINHIETYGSHHSDAIVTSDIHAADRFVAEVDSAAVLVNASTRFNDGGELGLGAEIGISTDRLHARGPCGLRELTTYKYVVRGSGHVRG